MSENYTIKYIKENIDGYVESFKLLYLDGYTVHKACDLLKIPRKWGSFIKIRNNIPTLERWKRLNLPEKFSEQTLEILYGTLLGDASLLVKRNNNGNERKLAYFVVGHSPKQMDYIIHKKEALKELNLTEIKTQADIWKTQRCYSTEHPHLTEIRNEFYIDGVKIVSRSLLDKLSAKSIAYWFMDDGSSAKSGFKIATCSFSFKEHEIIKEYFLERWGIEVKISNGKYNRIGIWGINAIKFKKIIESFIIDSLKYKIELSEGTGTKFISKDTIKDIVDCNLTTDEIAKKYNISKSSVIRLKRNSKIREVELQKVSNCKEIKIYYTINDKEYKVTCKKVQEIIKFLSDNGAVLKDGKWHHSKGIIAGVFENKSRHKISYLKIGNQIFNFLRNNNIEEINWKL